MSRRHEDQPEEPFQWRGHRPEHNTTRQRSASSALEFRSASTPESYLNAPSTATQSKASRQTSLDSRRSRRSSSSAPAKRDGHRTSRGDSVTARSAGAMFHRERGIPDGKICLHTHHHHYWILSDSLALKAMPKQLRSSRERVPLRRAGEDNRQRAGDLAMFPDESDMENLAESRRPPSRNTNHRYCIDG